MVLPACDLRVEDRELILGPANERLELSRFRRRILDAELRVEMLLDERGYKDKKSKRTDELRRQ
jgi:hypothetical protein